MNKLENVAIAIHRNLRPPDAAPQYALIKFEVGQPLRCCLIAFILLIR